MQIPLIQLLQFHFGGITRKYQQHIEQAVYPGAMPDPDAEQRHFAQTKENRFLQEIIFRKESAKPVGQTD